MNFDTIVDKTHFVRDKNFDHYDLIKKIQQNCNYNVKIAFLIEISFNKRFFDDFAMFKIMQYDAK